MVHHRLMRLRAVFRREVAEADFDEELKYHLDREIERNLARGMTREEARRAARRGFGDPDIMKDEARETWRWRWLDELSGDVCYALRSLRTAPGFTFVAVFMLAVAIGATSTVFSVIHGVLVRPLPYPDPDRIVRINTLVRGEQQSERNLSPPNFVSLSETAGQAFVALSALTGTELTLDGVGDARTVAAVRVSASFFDVMGVAPHVGRSLHPDENESGRHRVAVIGHGIWQDEFGADPGIAGRAISLNGEPHTIVGVMPPGFSFPAGTELWVPLIHGPRYSATTTDGRFRNTWLPVLGRLNPEIDLERARDELRSVGRRLAIAFPESNSETSFTAVPLRDEIVGEVSTPLILLFGAVSLVLLVACANVVGLQLARATSRSGEMTIRAALGATRGRLLRQMTVESMVLGLLGGSAGLVLALWATNALVAMQPEGLPRVDSIRLDGAVLAFTLGIALTAGMISGIAPALRATDWRLSRTMRVAGRGTVGSWPRERLRRGLVVGQLATAMVLLVVAGLLLRSLATLLAVDPGFGAERVLSFRVALPAVHYADGDAVRGFYDRLLQQLHAQPSVEEAGGVTRLPIARGTLASRFSVDGEGHPGDPQPSIHVLTITPGYFRALGIPLVAGRDIAENDGPATVPVVVINHAAANRFFPGENPIGRRLTRFSYDPIEQASASFTIVGVVADVRSRALHQEPRPEAFFAHAQVPFSAMYVVARAASDPATLAHTLRRELVAMDPRLSAPEIQSMERIVSMSVARPRFVAGLLTFFAAVALLLTAVGIFGLLNYTVSQRIPEIGVRIALGARPGAVLLMVIRGALILALAGLAIGICGALAFSRILRSQLFGVSTTDPVTYAAVVLLLAGTALVAVLVPARRAASVDPVAAMRQE